MEEKNKNPLHVLQSGNEPAHAADSTPQNDKKDKDKEAPSFTLPEAYLLAQEMNALFDEDKVTHVQGHSEPEAD